MSMTQEEAKQRAEEIRIMATQLCEAIEDASKRGLIIDFNIGRKTPDSPFTLTFEAKQKLV